MERYVVAAPPDKDVEVAPAPSFLEGFLSEGVLFRSLSGKFEISLRPSPWDPVKTLTSRTVPRQVQLAFSWRF